MTQQELLARMDEKVATIVREVKEIRAWRISLDGIVTGLVAEMARIKESRGWREQIIAGLIVSVIIGVFGAGAGLTIWLVQRVGI